MNAQDTRPTPPAWLNLHAVVSEQTCVEMAELGDRIEAAIADLEPALEQRYRILRDFDDAARGLDQDAWDAVHQHSGTLRLVELMYLLAAHVDGAAGEGVDDVHEVPWLKRVRAELGLDEWNVKADSIEADSIVKTASER